MASRLPVLEENQELMEVIKDYLETVDHIEKCKSYKDSLVEKLSKMAGNAYKLSTDFEGKESYKAGDYKLEFDFRLNRSIDKAKANEAKELLGRELNEIFNVDLKYKSAVFGKNSDFTEYEQSLIKKAITTKRGSLGLKITKQENKEN